MNKLLSDLQFCQMENDLLRQQLKTMKMDINSMKKEITQFFKEKEFIDPYSQYQVGTIVLKPQDQQNLLEIIQKIIKIN